jgi:hypothetical protein
MWARVDVSWIEFLLAHVGSALMVIPFYERRTKMSPYFNKLLFAAVAIAALLTIQVFASSVSAAGPSLGFPSGKPYYGSSNQRASQSAGRSRTMYRSTAPVIVRTESAPNAVAQAPSEQRSYSYEPSQQSVSGPCGCGSTVEPAPATAQRSTETRRSYSYEPSTSDSYSAPSAPRMQSRSSQSSRTPKFLLPKTDPNKYRNQ